MPRDLDLMGAHVEALFTHDAAGRMLRVNEPNGAPAPRFFLGRTADGPVLRFRHDVADDVRAELEAAAAADALTRAPVDSPTDPARYVAILARVAPVQSASTGPAFYCPDAQDLPAGREAVHITEANAALLQPYLHEWAPDVRHSQPLFAVAVDGHAVAVCASVRQTAVAYEAGVETVPAYRGRGYAPRAVSAWARAVRDAGRVPLYSTSWQNAASRAVARKVGLVQFGSDLSVA